MYQRIIELLRIHGYTKEDTMADPIYIKTVSGTKKGVFVLYDENPDGSRVTQEDIEDMMREGRRTAGEGIPILVILLSEHGKAVFMDPEHRFDELYEPVSMILRTGGETRPEER